MGDTNKRTPGFFLLLSLFILASFSFCSTQAQSENNHNEPVAIEAMVKGRVEKVMTEEQVDDPLSREKVTSQTLRVKILSGKFRGRQVILDHQGTGNPVYDIKVSAGDAVLVALELQDGKIKAAYIADHLREPQLYILGVAFVVLLLAMGWRQGAKALCALLITLVLIWGVLLPGFLRGYPPVPLTIVTAVFATAVTLLTVGGFTLKSLTSILGTLGGVGISGFLALSFGKSAHLTGFGSEEAAMLLYIPQNIQLDIQGLLFAGIIIGALGASMDVSMSIASSVAEVKQVSPGLKTWSLIRSGMNVGRDIMGTMANTLILAYTGSSLQLILIFMAYKESLLKIMNLDMVASEVVRALSGSIGMVMVIPLTAVIAGVLFGRSKESAVGKEQAVEEIPPKETEEKSWFS